MATADKSTPEEYEEIKQVFTDFLSNQQLRKTPERYAILEEIYLKGGHFDVESLYINMKNKNYRVSRATVYNTLDLLVDSGLVIRHQFGKNISLFEKSHKRKQHDHVICKDCDKIMEFCDPRVLKIKETVEETLGVKIDSHTLYFYAHCGCVTENKDKK